MWRALRDRVLGWDVFISYAREDEPWAHAVEKLLQLGGYRVFRDRTQLLLGGHLDDLLRHVEKSTMLVVLVSEHAVGSNWVHRELTTYLARPRARQRLVPVFVDPRYPHELPERFQVLGDYAGIVLPEVARAASWAGTVAADADHGRLVDPEARALSDGVARRFAASRKATRQLGAAGSVVMITAAVLGVLLRAIDSNEKRDALLKAAAVASRDARFDVAEHALSEAWLLDQRPSIRDAYRDARERRSLEQPTILEVTREEAVLAVDQATSLPYVIVHQQDDLVLLCESKRSTFARACAGSPEVVTRGALVVWRCGRSLGAMAVGTGEPRQIELPAEPAALRLGDGRVELLFHEGGVLQRGIFTAPGLEPYSPDVLSTDAEGGSVGFCPGSAQLAWRVHMDGSRAVFERWDDATAEARVESIALPPSADGLPRLSSWIGRVSVAPDCERFVLEYAPFTTERHSTFEATRFRLRATRPVDRFASEELRSIVVAPDASGLEALYLTDTKELRAFVLTDVVVRSVTTKSIASDVERVTAWPCGASDTQWLLSLARDSLSVHRDGVLWSRHPLGVGEPVRAVSAPDGASVVVEGDARTILWRRAQTWPGGDPPPPEAVLADVGIGVLEAGTSSATGRP